MKKLISYILPVYNEDENIEIFYKVLTKTIERIEKIYEFELVFINDGSKDNSLKMLTQMHEKDDRVKVINFSRNFGHQIAITAGLDNCEGDAVIIMDTDLQDPPRVSLELIEKWEKGFDVVFAKRRNRKDGIFKKITAYLFYRILNKFIEFQIPLDTGDFRLVDKKVVKEFRKFRERNRFVRGLFSYLGFAQTAVLFDRDERHAGHTKYPFKKMLKFALDGITSFSVFPLKLITQFGFVVSMISFIGIVYALVLRIFFPEITVSGWTFLVIAILFLGGVQMIMLGIIGEYIGRIYSEVQGRPLYIIESIYSNKPKVKS